IVEPERTLSRALTIGTCIVMVLYLLLNVSYIRAVLLAELSGVQEVAHAVARSTWGESRAATVSLFIALSLIVPISAMLLIGPRVVEAMANDGFLPNALGALNRRGVPARAVWTQAGIATAIALTSSFGALLIYIGFTLNIFAALTVIGLFRLRQSGR